MKKFILRYRGSGDETGSDLDRLRRTPGITVLDEASPRMVLVQGREEDIRQLVESLPEWVAVEERTFDLPDPRPGLKGSLG